jgi:hypothetical protein
MVLNGLQNALVSEPLVPSLGALRNEVWQSELRQSP